MAAKKAAGSPNGKQSLLQGNLQNSLHSGNTIKPTLEMTLIFDCNLSKQEATEQGKEIITVLKQTDEIFRNVRLNVVRWMADDQMLREVTAAPILQMGRYFEDYEPQTALKRLEILTEYLKKFDARSRLLILVTDGNYKIENTEVLHQSLNPFLYRKILILEEGTVKIGRQLM